MPLIHNLGFPRIGAQRELKFALESYWRGDTNSDALEASAASLRSEHWQLQNAIDLVPVGDFSLYDQVLDMSFLLGNVPQRIAQLQGDELQSYFRLARGRAPQDSDSQSVAAGELTKWFDTNYHYIVPEFDSDTEFKLNVSRLLSQIIEARTQGHNAKPVILGPLSYLRLGKARDGSNKLDLLPKLLSTYNDLLEALQASGIEWLQIDEPILVTELDAQWQRAFTQAYHELRRGDIKLLLTSYFGELQDNLMLACELPVDGIHIDGINARSEIAKVVDWLPAHKVLSLGVIDGRNIWKADLNTLLDYLEPIHKRLGDRLWLAPSCSLLHVPVDLRSETALAEDVHAWLAFAVQKLAELKLLAQALEHGREQHQQALQANAKDLQNRRASNKTSNPQVRAALLALRPEMSARQTQFTERSALQQSQFNLPLFPTTSIGSFPQTVEIRRARKLFRENKLDQREYEHFLQREIRHCLQQQESLGLDVLVHGEAERNDMVEYFSEHLEGYARSEYGWVQSYGSRCVKPPILFGDVARPKPITVPWAKYAQEQTSKPVKGMLTGPVTLLNWSFVRDDQPRSETCRQLALAVRDEVLDLEKAGIAIIQIDEAALREGLPLRQAQWSNYLDWAVACFRLSANGVQDSTQIHTHMCYSEFNDIMEAIAAMDADVITIETSRSDMELLDAFDQFAYPNGIGPGVYDIHSPNIPHVAHIVTLMKKAAQRIPAERLWVNPDCGLKTRRWEEVAPALNNMVDAANRLRKEFA